ncbi:MAG: patatin-like phospholipase family protein [Solirubrobacterales bacterium]|nr:patatin-like phospholipase family protein [Solirubrobacterales bacterium]
MGSRNHESVVEGRPAAAGAEDDDQAGDWQRPRGKIALVLAGGGARGAYEVGVLSALAPVLEARGERVEIVVGTSAGALNAAHLAASAHLTLTAAVDDGMEAWRTLRYRDVTRSLLSPRALGRLARFIATVVGAPVTEVRSLLDTTPLRATLHRLICFERIADNVADGALALKAAAVVATSYETGRSVVFHHGGETPPTNLDRGIDFVETELDDVHLRASAAIPVVFPAVEVTHPESVGGWYGDGGTRLNAPLEPALALGAERVIVIGMNSSLTPDDAPLPSRPDLLDGAASLLGVLADQLTSDVATLTSINEAAGDDGVRDAPGEPRRKLIPYIFIVPRDRLTIGGIAREVYKRRYGKPRALLRAPNVALLGRILDASCNSMHGELFSYLFFAREFIDELIELGRQDAERWLAEQHEDWPWRHGRPPGV